MNARETDGGSAASGTLGGAHAFALFTVFVWGFTFVSTKVLLEDFAPIEVLFGRFTIGLIALCILRPHALRLERRSHEWLFIAAGITGVTLYYLMENVALTFANASVVGVLVAVSPLSTTAIAFALGREKISAGFVAGLIVALAGVALVCLGGGGATFSAPGVVLALGAALMWSLYSTLVKRISDLGYETIASTKRTFVWGIVFMVPLMPLMGAQLDLGRLVDPLNAANMLFLGLAASAGCFATWGIAVSRLGAAKTSIYIYLVPVITAVASAAILSEMITVVMAAGIVLTIAGLALSEGRLPALRRRGHK
jgi:drug/metabolite transporter (DMT)-like permease